MKHQTDRDPIYTSDSRRKILLLASQGEALNRIAAMTGYSQSFIQKILNKEGNGNDEAHYHLHT